MKWVFGKAFEHEEEVIASEVDTFLGFQVHLEYPRCVLAVGGRGFQKHYADVTGKGDNFFYKNITVGYEMVIHQWIDKPSGNSEELLNFLYSASTHFRIHLEDELESKLLIGTDTFETNEEANP